MLLLYQRIIIREELSPRRSNWLNMYFLIGTFGEERSPVIEHVNLVASCKQFVS